MLNRRTFVRSIGALSLAATLPAGASTSIAPLPRRNIPGTDESLAVIGLGNSQAFRDGNVETSSALVSLFLEHGGSYIDVGGRSREVVGRIMRDSFAQEDLFLANYVDGTDVSSLRGEIRALLDVQGKDSLDLIHIRPPDLYRERHDAYVALKEEGLTRYIGIARSGKDGFPAIMKLMEEGAVDFIQVNYSLIEPEAADEILPLAQETGTAVAINRPFINGQYFDIVRNQELPDWVAEFDCHSWAQFSLKYILAHPAVNCVLTETANPRHAVDNIGAGYGRLPDPDEQQRMQSLISSMT